MNKKKKDSTEFGPHYKAFEEAIDEMGAIANSLSSMTPEQKEAAAARMAALANMGSDAFDAFWDARHESEAPASAKAKKGKK